MRRLFPILLLIGFFAAACDENTVEIPEKQSGVSMLLTPLRSANALNDPDNLVDEYAIVNLHVFLANPGTATITNKFINQAFTSANDTTILNSQWVTLPLDPSTLTNKDIYVIANCDDVASLNAVQTVSDIQALKTPQATAAAGLTTARGLPMYGQFLNANLITSTTANPLTVMLTRTCAKMRVTLTFTGASYIGSNNTFAIENAAAYTYYVKNDTFKIATSNLVNYPQMTFTQNTAQQFQAITYVYESLQLPRLHLYTTLNGTPTEFIASANFPLPVRNYLYDIQIQILPQLAAAGAPVARSNNANTAWTAIVTVGTEDPAIFSNICHP
ncbi:hypothetical protein FACS189421_10740 [Bacteroidia bacterium]|nr:hypothetical protein FACS189421_10740 [Bacteroidia bacterium]GHT05595.1 hypothetical protein FACS189423_09910 [Bacteroidia bacterium]GHT48461.1 hypothetical protein FACS189440_12140 [Bacteroidia bacterium]